MVTLLATRNVRSEVDVSADVEHDDAPLLADGVTEGAGAAVVEVGDVKDITAAATTGQGAESLGAGKCEQMRRNFGRGLVGGRAGRTERD